MNLLSFQKYKHILDLGTGTGCPVCCVKSAILLYRYDCESAITTTTPSRHVILHHNHILEVEACILSTVCPVCCVQSVILLYRYDCESANHSCY